MKILLTNLMCLFMSYSCQIQTNTLPSPSGNYKVSIHYVHFTDESRIELFDNDLDSKREITAKVWYPTDKKSACEPYVRNADFAIKYCMLPEIFRDLRTNSGRDLPVSSKEKKYPVLLFSHGWGEHYSQNSILMEELASHGYIVFSIAHHFECRFSSYPDGRVIHLDVTSRRFQKIWREMQNPQAQELIMHKVFEAGNDQERRQVLEEMVKACPSGLTESPKYWAEDIAFFLDQLTILNKQSRIFKKKLDLDHIGVLGMSMGGIASGEIGLADKRVKAGVNIDGGLSGSLLDKKLHIPFLFMNSSRFLGYGHLFTRKSSVDCYSLSVKGSGHYNFSDYSIYPAPLVAPLLGTIDGNQTIKIMNVVVLAFFDKYLKGKKDIEILKLAEEFPEIESVKNF